MQYPKYFDPTELHRESEAVLEQKIDALLAAMTPEEKLNLCHGHPNPDGCQIGNAGYHIGVPRLGVPEMRMYDGPAGVTSIYETTGLPVQEMLAASWDRDLAYQYGKVEGSENVAISGNTQLGSQYDVARLPQFPRVKDMMGEDPFLITELSIPETHGIQDAGAVATAKHFGPSSVGGGPDMQHPAEQPIDEQTLHQLIFPPFEAAAKAGGAGAFMCCYNKLGSDFVSASSYAQKTVLREYWNYKGYMMSDWGANHSLTTGKGMDMEMHAGVYNSNERILKGIEKGRLTWDDVNTAVRHVLYGFGSVGYLNLVQLDENGNALQEEGRTEPIHMPDRYQEAVQAGLLDKNAQICLQIAREGAVLLKNENQALPLTPADWSGENSVALIGLGATNLLSGAGQERSYGRLSRMQAPAAALQALAGPDAQITAETGLEYFGDPIPAECFYQDAACLQPGLRRTYGVEDNGEPDPMMAAMAETAKEAEKAPTSTGGMGLEFKGIAAADEEEEEIPYEVQWTNTLAADMEGFETGSFCCTDAEINFTCGTLHGSINQTYKNAADGTAFEKGCAFTWEGYLRVPASGEYTLILQAIGGNTSFQIQVKDSWLEVGRTELRESTQWPWGSLVCTPEGMEVHGGWLTLEAGKAYPIRLRASATISHKDLQIRLAWITPEKKADTRARALKAAEAAGKVLFFLSDDYSYDVAGKPFRLEIAEPCMEPPAVQMELLREIRSVMQPDAQLIVLHNYGQLYALGEVDALADAVMNIWTPGQEGGQAVAELLTGAVNPSGKQALSVPARDCDTLVTDTDAHKTTRYLSYIAADGKRLIDFDEGIFTGYRWHDRTGVKPLYAFGHGLSYTEFEYSALQISGQSATFTVTNTGSIPGTEIAQVYLGAAENIPAHIQMAQKQLCGFARLENIQPGESRTVSIEIPERSFCCWDPQAELQTRPDGTKDKWVHTAGPRTVYIGGSSDNLPLQAVMQA